ncbi:post-GPI attachment to proteins factor 6 isoform X3 [Ochotona curzoniae]|uniref:post-GPI attachment to proteins factor 6 isoform X3 n=1 Tax=Ochotona curzoniae TaxID=130825 RepID=UPI001B348DB1|nr:post-GPI attachment to proteins factor 6 isoform X3 [Ochotona curzoniae]
MGRAGTGAGGAAGAVAGPLLLLLLALPRFAAGDGGKSEPGLVFEHFSQAPQKLSTYSWYGSARLFRFHVPRDTVLLRWLLQASQDSGLACAEMNITVHFRHGAPPVINPLDTRFPDDTLVPQSFYVKMLLGNASVNMSHPAPGDWFVVAHLPPSSQKIEVKGFVPTCAYVFQPDLLVTRVIEFSIMEPDVPLAQTLFSHPSYLKVFIPEYTQQLQLELQGCTSNQSGGCPVRLSVGSATSPGSFQKMLSCAGPNPSCQLLLASPPWDQWLHVMAESLAGPRASVAFSAVAVLTACRPWTVPFPPLVQNPLNQSGNASARQLTPGPGGQELAQAGRAGGDPFCLLHYPVVREDLDVMSVRFQPLDGIMVLVRSGMPSLMQLRLNTGMDSGGSLTVVLRANQTTLANGTLVAACVTVASPFLSFNTSVSCTTAFFQGHALSLSPSSYSDKLIIPYPETATWYLSLQLLCPDSPQDCEQVMLPVETSVYLEPCWNDCGRYGQCLLLRRHGYLYAGCSCKAGWRGWSCSDNSTAQTPAQQRVAALLLTLSNVMFLAPIAVSLHRALLVEASVYCYTMFFSTVEYAVGAERDRGELGPCSCPTSAPQFYHACDQPGEAVLCILSYDTLQYCDFLGSGVSAWVTVLCMARLKTALKHVLYLLGTLVIAMSLQLDRRGIWNMMGPCLFAFVIMASMWVYRCGHRHRCYPTSWQRWAFFLLPGICMAFVGITIYTSMMTNDNYYYTHSIWHVLLAASAALLLPPRDRCAEPWACSPKLPCHYQICRNDRDELYTVT